VSKYIYINSKNYEKEEGVVNKKIIMKGVLLLIVLAVFSLGFVGCGTVTPITTGTVYIIMRGSWRYNIYMDYNLKFSNVASGTGTITNVSTGYHFFQAIHTWGWTYGYDSVTKYIAAGSNYVYLYP